MLVWLLWGVLGLILTLFIFIVVQFVVIPARNPVRKVKGPPYKGWFSTAHVAAVLDAEKSPAIEQHLISKYGRNIRVKGVGVWDDRIHSLDHVAITYVLNNPSKYQKAWQSRRFITRLIGCGMLSAEGLVHKRQRKVSTPAFSPQNLRSFIPTFFSKAEELCDRWDGILQSSSDKLDVCHWVSRATFDVIGVCAFDYELNAIQNESNEVYLAFKEMFEIAVSQGPGLKTTLAIYFPIIWKLFPDDSSRIVDKSWEIIFRIGRHLIQQKKKAIEEGREDDKDLLSRLLKSNLSPEIPPDQKISDDDLLFQISTFLFAGSDTTSLAMTWVLFLLSTQQYSNVQKELREELLSVDSTSSQTVIFSDLESLQLLDNVIKEGLRVIPPVHSSMRVAMEDDVIPTSEPVILSDGTKSPGVPVGAGTMIHIAVAGFALDKTVWGEDAWEFKPDRWNHLPERVKSLPGLYSNLLCFSGGPRSCIGMRFSIMEMKVLLYHLLTRFEFSDPEDILRANVVLTRPFVRGKFKEGSKCPIRVTPLARR